MRVETPASRATDPVTSHAAEADTTRSGRRAAQQQQVAEAVRQHPGVTSAELARRTGIDRHAIGRRLPECETAGAVRRGAPVRDPQTGRTGVSWWPAEYTEDDYRRDCLHKEIARRVAAIPTLAGRREKLEEIDREYGQQTGSGVRAELKALWHQGKGAA